jgi:hypothetical protein
MAAPSRLTWLRLATSKSARFGAASPTYLCERFCTLSKRWAIEVAKRRGSKRAKVALARKIAVILHRMWVDGSTYRWTETQPIAAQA